MRVLRLDEVQGVVGGFIVHGFYLSSKELAIDPDAPAVATYDELAGMIAVACKLLNVPALIETAVTPAIAIVQRPELATKFTVN
jgi:hypothetical protein